MMLRILRLVSLLALCVDLSTSIVLPGFKTTYDVIAEGEGTLLVQPKASVTVHATGIVAETGKKFWSTKDPGQKPFSYTAGVKAVIVGWDQGVLGMKKGEKRELTIPADEGYGKRGFPAWGIPPDGTLNFEIEVLSITPSKSEL